ncbi:MAG: DUF1223 domain-containing protein [Cyclobacteriaceae bacterium]|nr:DUF1223 domain-containing protein [Cyclobacteriaceae bacterium]
MRVLLLFFCTIVFAQVNAQNGFAVVELFTSQGCSSCPPADRVLSQLLDDADKKGTKVYGLSFHVDYWNYIGWKDPYSSAVYSQRQRNYAKSIDAHRVYTPQMVVNGSTEFVGSNKTEANRNVEKALTTKAAYAIEIRDWKVEGSQGSFQYQLDKAPHGERLNIAVVERDIENYVSKGENRGKTLSHDNVVRVFESITLKQNGKLKVDLSEVNPEKSSLILYIQDDNLKVLGATSVPVGKS